MSAARERWSHAVRQNAAKLGLGADVVVEVELGLFYVGAVGMTPTPRRSQQPKCAFYPILFKRQEVAGQGFSAWLYVCTHTAVVRI